MGVRAGLPFGVQNGNFLMNAYISFRLKFHVDLELQMPAIDSLNDNFSVTDDINLRIIRV
jgi:hypothetical protein